MRYNKHILTKRESENMLNMYTLQRGDTYLVSGKFVTLAEAQKSKSSMYRYKTMLTRATQSIKQAGDKVAVFTL